MWINHTRVCHMVWKIEGTGFNLVGSRPPSKWTEHILVCLVRFQLCRRQAAIPRIRHSRSLIGSIILICVVLREWKKSNIFQFRSIFFNFFLFVGAICTVKNKPVMLHHFSSFRQLSFSPLEPHFSVFCATRPSAGGNRKPGYCMFFALSSNFCLGRSLIF